MDKTCIDCKHPTFFHKRVIDHVVYIDHVENYKGMLIGSCPNALMAICHEDDPVCNNFQDKRTTCIKLKK